MHSQFSAAHLLLGTLLLLSSCSAGSGDPVEPGNTTGGAAANATGGAASGGATASTGGISASTGGIGEGGAVATGGYVATGGSGTVDTLPKLEHVLAYNQVDISPKTGVLRGHTGGGEDEKLLESLAEEHGFELEVSGDAAVFTAEKLSEVDVIVFASPHYEGQKYPMRDALPLRSLFVVGADGSVGTTPSRLSETGHLLKSLVATCPSVPMPVWLRIHMP